MLLTSIFSPLTVPILCTPLRRTLIESLTSSTLAPSTIGTRVTMTTSPYQQRRFPHPTHPLTRPPSQPGRPPPGDPSLSSNYLSVVIILHRECLININLILRIIMSVCFDVTENHTRSCFKNNICCTCNCYNTTCNALYGNLFTQLDVQ